MLELLIHVCTDNPERLSFCSRQLDVRPGRENVICIQQLIHFQLGLSKGLDVYRPLIWTSNTTINPILYQNFDGVNISAGNSGKTP
jgi:hypothetical protein